MLNRKKGAFFGGIVGDVLGGPLEFVRRDYKNITDMIEGGIHKLTFGEWTDDTSMTWALAESLGSDGFSLKSQMEHYSDWYQKGMYCTRDKLFDIGLQVEGAIQNYIEDKITPPLFVDENQSGNGSIMRLSPVVIKYYSEKEDDEKFQELIQYAKLSSKTTHPNKCCQDACGALALIINRCLNGKLTKEEILNVSEEDINNIKISNESIVEIMKGSYKNKQRDEISSSGYVVHTLEAALWCFLNSNDYNSAVLLAANLGHDADTMASVTGQIAGAYYGYENINKNWLNNIQKKEDLSITFDKLIQSNK